MPAEINEILFQCQSARPTAERSQKADEPVNTRHDRIIVLNEVVYRQRPKQEVVAIEVPRDDEIGRDERTRIYESPRGSSQSKANKIVSEEPDYGRGG